MTFVIVDPATGAFWSGLSWQPEYPDARKYRRLAAARAEAERVRGDVIDQYGLADETIVFRGGPPPFEPPELDDTSDPDWGGEPHL